jgi:NodT family efflux transporter outer membrane factor (OMF) lipoprotein
MSEFILNKFQYAVQPASSRRKALSLIVSLASLCCMVPSAFAWPFHSHAPVPLEQKPLKAGKITMSAIEAAPKEITPQRWEELESSDLSALKDFNLQTAFPNRDWWRNFKDPYLEESIDRALLNNRDLKVANLRVRQAKAAMQQVRATQLPTLDIQGRYSRQRIGGAGVTSTSLPGGGALTGGSLVNAGVTSASGTPNTSFNLYSVPLIATYEVDLWGKNRMKVKSARMSIEQQSQLAKAMALNISTQVATAYMNLLRLDAQISTAQALLDNGKQTMAIQQLLFESGISSYDALLITSEDLAGYQQNLTQAQGQLGVYAHQLMLLRGEPPVAAENIQRAKLSAIQFPTDIPTGIPSELITRRPDIVASEIAMRQTYVNVSEARREFLPTINLVGSLGYASRDISNLFDWKSHTGNLISVLDQSLFSGGAKIANLRLQKSLALQQMQNYQGALLRAFQQVEDSLVTMKADYGGYQQNLLAIQFSEKAVKLNDNRYKLGISPRLDTLTARRQLLQFQQVANQNKASSLVDLVNLYSALGGGYTP